MSQEIQVNSQLNQLAFLDKELYHGRVIININGGFILTKDDEQPAINHLVNIFSDASIKSPIKGEESVVLFVYLKQFAVHKIRQTFVISLTALLTKLFPNMLYRCFLCDAGSSFKTMMVAVTSLINKDAQKKIIYSKSGGQ